MTRTRFPKWMYSRGVEPSPRFTLANERTFLAWIRVALALIVGGVALEAFAFPSQPSLRLAASILLLALGLAVPVLAWFSWAATERALRCGEPLPASHVAPTFIAGTITVVALVLLGMIVR